MKKNLGLSLSKPADLSIEDWVTSNLKKIEEAAHVDAAIDSADAFSAIDHTGYTILETFDPATVTLEELGRAFATFLQYCQNHGPRKA